MSEQLELHKENLRVIHEELKLLKGSTSSASDSKKFLELDNKYRRIKQERIELLRTQSQNTQKLLLLTDQLTEQQHLKTSLEDDLSQIQAKAEEQQRKFQDYELQLSEKNLNIEILQDELQALQLELLQTDERVKSLQSENKQLVDRWLLKVNETVDRLNAEVSNSQMRDEHETNVLVKTKLPFKTTNLCSSPSTDLIYCSGDNLGEYLLTRSNLTANLALAIPNAPDSQPTHPNLKTTFSANSDLLIGVSSYQPETASIWNVESGLISSQLSAGFGKGFIDLATVNSSNDVIFAIHKGNLLRFYDLPRSFCLWTEQLDSTPKQLVIFDDRILLLTTDGRLQLWDAKSRRLIKKTLTFQLPCITKVAASEKSIVALTDRSVVFIDPSTLKLIQTLSLSVTLATSSHLLTFDDLFMIGCKNKIHLGNISEHSIVSTLSTHEYAISAMGLTMHDSIRSLISVDAENIVSIRRIQ